jgi:hypothetical protein
VGELAASSVKASFFGLHLKTPGNWIKFWQLKMSLVSISIPAVAVNACTIGKKE